MSIRNPNFTLIVAGTPVTKDGRKADANGTATQAAGLAINTTASPGAGISVQKDGFFELGDWSIVTGSLALESGSTYYLSTTPGMLTTTAPSAPNMVQRIGVATSSMTLSLEFEISMPDAATTITGTHGESRSESQISELITLSTSGLTTDSTTNLLPANSIIEDVVYRVETSITGGTKAKGTITLTGLPLADETFVIGSQTFTWKALRSVAGEVTIGASAAAACTNIIAAVTADLPSVVATQGAGTTVIITNVVGGVVGNSVTFTESSTNMAVNGSGTLGGTTSGVDADSFKLGDATIAARFTDTVTPVTAGTSGVAAAHVDQSGTSGPRQTAAAKLRVTLPGIPQGGAILVTVFSRSYSAPTS